MILNFFKKLCIFICTFFLTITLFIALAITITVIYTYPKLPKLTTATHYQPKSPLKIYTSDGELIGVFGAERRKFTPIEEFPSILKSAVLAAEDRRFYQHGPIDVLGILRAIKDNLVHKSIKSGASTLTQQVVKNLFLSNERTLKRKFKEALLAYKLERSLTKDQILELYFNHIYLGKRSYGFAAAAQGYFNKDVKDLTIAEAAMLAGLPKSPSFFNPIANPQRAKQRQLYVLNNMLKSKSITKEQYDEAVNEQLSYESSSYEINENALYIAEMVRAVLFEKYGESIYTSGLIVLTTIDSKDQKIATDILRQYISNYAKQEAYHGAEGYVDMKNINQESLEEKLNQILYYKHNVQGLIPAIVLNITPSSIKLYVKGEDANISINRNNVRFINNYVLNDKYKDKQIRPGAIVRVRKINNSWTISQLPEIQGALVSIDANTGAIKSLVGGFDFYQKQFNRATQAWRQPGSAFKPFVYSAALNKGYTPNSIILDAPICFSGIGARGKAWCPRNSNRNFAGPVTFANALTWSRNVPSVKILQSIGITYTINYLQRFGFRPENQPKNYSMVLGAGSVTPLLFAEAYAVFANGGYRVKTYFIDKIYTSTGKLLAKTKPLVAKENAQLVINPNNAYTMYKLLQQVVQQGTAKRALALGRKDVAGKTGTTNNQKEVWFAGFNTQLVTIVYIGNDNNKSLWKGAYGGTVALPMWVDYMKYALKSIPDKQPITPPKSLKYVDPFLSQDNKTTKDQSIEKIDENKTYNKVNYENIRKEKQDNNFNNLF